MSPSNHVSTLTLLRVSLSAAVMNAVVPLALAVQIALLGRRDTGMQASFCLVATTTQLGTSVFNFLVDGVTAKVGTSVGAARWTEAAGRVRMAFAAALVCGSVASGILFALRPLLFRLYGAAPVVARHAGLYFTFRVAAVPAQCVASATTGCLGGYRRVHAATALNVARAVAEASAVAAAVVADAPTSNDERMLLVGIAHVACVALHATVGVALVLLLVPVGAETTLRVLAFAENAENAAEDADENARRAASVSETIAFATDGASMFVRAFLLQGTFFAAMIVASRELGPHGLAAHNVVCQLWMLSSYVVDGLATAGTVLGARLAGEAAAAAAEGRDPKPVALPSLRSICARLLLLGLAFGCAFAAALFALRDAVVSAFTRDPNVVAALVAPETWRTLYLAQPLNALVFVYDGFMYAFQDFAYIRELMEVGVGYAFLPSLAWTAAGRPGGCTLGAVWKCKVGLNAWRAVGLATRVHVWLLSDAGFDALASRYAAAEDDDAGGDDAGDDAGNDDAGDDEASSRFHSRRAQSPTASEGTAPDSPVAHWRRRRRGRGGEGHLGGSTGGEDDLEAPLLSSR